MSDRICDSAHVKPTGKLREFRRLADNSIFLDLLCADAGGIRACRNILGMADGENNIPRYSGFLRYSLAVSLNPIFETSDMIGKDRHGLAAR